MAHFDGEVVKAAIKATFSSKSDRKKFHKTWSGEPSVPLYGPRFTPPSFNDVNIRNANPLIEATIAYLKPITVVHPVFFPELKQCPRDKAHQSVSWDSAGRLLEAARSTGFCKRRRQSDISYAEWTATRTDRILPRLRQKRGERSGMHCFATTNDIFWKS
ncbi:hypothetical protein PsYK624_167570 [Phanerochaete sordida]|uniref:Uncharacterized protein n=1 Tax=Phanerochaete sordida TaxID=48140 RepID=A0A9P3LM57_9APHY|nr:hypothetical protein PsYK624_167570 [Phanerochaete sordida]